MLWTFRILATLDALLLAAAFLYSPSGEDPAGAGLRLGFASVFALTLAALLVLYRFVHALWVRWPLLALLAVPPLLLGYGAWLSA